MRIGILECGVPPAPLPERYGSYDGMVRRLLGHGAAPDARDGGAVGAGTARVGAAGVGQAGSERAETGGDGARAAGAAAGTGGWTVESFSVRDGVLPRSATACDAYVLTGSPAGVYDPLPWIPPLLDFLRAARGRAKLVGICFGHQAMAQAFGGEVVASPKGWGVGLHRYDLRRRRPWMGEAGVPAAVVAPASHQDQVVRLPAGAQVVLDSAFTPFAGLDYGDAISFQFHPEFSREFGAALTALRRDTFPQLAEAAIASYGQPSDSALVGGWIRRFLRAG